MNTHVEASVAVSPSAAPRPHARNPGPSWGYSCMRLWDRFVPEMLYRPCRAIGTWIALANMPVQRRHSRAYLRVVFRREPRLIEVFRHFFTFSEVLMLKLRVAHGLPHRGVLAPASTDFRNLIESGTDALLGTFHFGHSDLVGFLFGGQEKRRVSMVRQRVGNSHDVDKLGEMFGNWVSFVWVNEGDNLLFALKDALANPGSLALKCDRIEFSARTEVFNFLGARRVFPFTIYYLALIFNRPVLLSVGVPSAPGETLIHCTPRWNADPTLSRADNLASARAHFQAFLVLVESLIRQNPYWWFNFLELNPEAPSARV